MTSLLVLSIISPRMWHKILLFGYYCPVAGRLSSRFNKWQQQNRCNGDYMSSSTIFSKKPTILKKYIKSEKMPEVKSVVAIPQQSGGQVG